MSKDSTRGEAIPVLLQNLLALLAAHRPAFGREGPYRRGVALVFGELFAFARHTVTQGLLALGLTDTDWSAFYRLFSHGRFDEERLSRCLFEETLAHSAVEQPYVVGADSTQVPRTSLKMPGTSWLRAPKTAAFQRGLQRAQRFVHGAWLPETQAGYSRAIPLRFLPAFPAKAVAAAGVQACQEWAAGLQFVRWVRQRLDAAGRAQQLLLVLADGAYDTLEFWRGLPERTVAAVRTAKNRRLRELPPPHKGRGARRKYGAVAAKPAAWLAERDGWQTVTVTVRGRQLQLRYRVLGPYLRERLPGLPLFLIIVGGATWKAGKREPKRLKYRKPAFYLVSTVLRDGAWQLPLPVPELLAWLWQRWELEVAHREMKNGFGVGEMQCWNPHAAVLSVQWSVWVYAVLLLAGYRTWGLLGGPQRRERWWPGASRWSLSTLWRSYRAAIWGAPEFRAIWTPSGANWPEKERWLAGLSNAVLAAART